VEVVRPLELNLNCLRENVRNHVLDPLHAILIQGVSLPRTKHVLQIINPENVGMTGNADSPEDHADGYSIEISWRTKIRS